MSNSGALTLTYPLDHGDLKNPDEFEGVLNYLFENELNDNIENVCRFSFFLLLFNRSFIYLFIHDRILFFLKYRKIF